MEQAGYKLLEKHEFLPKQSFFFANKHFFVDIFYIKII
jgi:hypothetical protein